jgi:hypothetical protein
MSVRLTHEVNSSLRLLETRQQCNDFVSQPALTASDEGFQLSAKYIFVLTGINEFRDVNVTFFVLCFVDRASRNMHVMKPP